MIKSILVLICACAALLISACASYPDVRPGVGGLNRVVVSGDTAEAAARSAISQATNYCDHYSKALAIVSEKKQYRGQMNEQDYNTAKRASKAAEMIGGTVWAMGDNSSSNVGGAVGLGGGAANTMLGKGYIDSMTFRCQ